jgi:hypothetical protein
MAIYDYILNIKLFILGDLIKEHIITFAKTRCKVLLSDSLQVNKFIFIIIILYGYMEL